MNPDEAEDRLRTSFAELRRADQRLAPPFDQHWRAAVRLSRGTEGRARPAHFPLVRVAAAVGAIAAVGVAAVLLNSRPARDALVAGRQTPAVAAPRRPEPREQDAAAPIEDWESPTAVLLELPPDEGSRPGENF